MGSSILNALQAAVWSLLAHVLTEAFFEKVLTRLTLAGLDRLAARTSNTLDNALVQDVRVALGWADHANDS